MKLSKETFFLVDFVGLIKVDPQKHSFRGVLKKGALKNFTKFTGKHLYQSLFFNKVTDLRPASYNLLLSYIAVLYEIM